MSRWTQQGDDVVKCELHGFSDASNVAYAAVVYQRLTLKSGCVVTSLLAAKSKVAPIKQLTIPRLELTAAVLLSKLMAFVKAAMKLPQVSCTCWTDSTIVLAWLKQHPSRWKTFVANRVTLVQTTVPSAIWRHVPTDQNPADCSSRGISGEQLARHGLWWKGPEWLIQSPDRWPQALIDDVDCRDLETKIQVSTHSASQRIRWDLESKFSSWPKLIRVTAYILKFVNRCRKPSLSKVGDTSKTNKSLTCGEIQQAKTIWLKQIQQDLFPNDINNLTSKNPVKKTSSLASLNPFLDSDGIMRVGGRLENSPHSYQAKHPVILKSHFLVTLIVRSVHERQLHAGPQLTLCSLREEYWIVRARQVVRAVTSKCVICTRERATIPTQIMGPLPNVRVTPVSRAFLHCGVDYAGPFLVRVASGRGRKSHKTYVALFVCMSTRAIHLELVNGYDTQSFLAAFGRFCSRRGLPNSVYSDNGTNFRGAD